MNTNEHATQNIAITLDSDQYVAATSLENTVVVAGAGSGKTTVLASHVMYVMIQQRIPISEILLLTFTRKGAAEMHHRIKIFLERTINTKQFLGQRVHNEQIAFLTEQLTLYHNAQISTIDSFSYRIAQSVFLRLGYIAPLQLTNSIQYVIAPFVYQWIVSHKESVLHTLLQQYPIDTVQQEILIPFLSEIGLAEDTPVPDFDTVFQSLMTHHIHTTKKFRTELEQFYTTACEDADTYNKYPSYNKYVSDLRAIIETITSMEAALTSNPISQHIESYATMAHTLKHDITIRFPSSKQGIFDSLKIFHKTLISEYRKRQYVPRCEAFVELVRHTTYFENMYSELRILADDWQQHRRNHINVCSFYDIAALAFHGLEKYNDIRQFFAGQYKCIIIDEFQDNNFMQKKLLYMLSNTANTDTVHTNTIQIEKHKYFFVGDPKQSIYGFRGAEVDSFLELHKEMDIHVPLQNNYRSIPQLITLFNTCFRELFLNEAFNVPHSAFIQESDTKASNPSITYEAQISPQSIYTDDELLDDTHIACEYSVLDYTKDDCQVFSKHEIEAYYIAQKVQHLVTKNKVPEHDIAILLRTKTLYPYLQKCLTQIDIPYTISDEATTLHKDVGYDFYSWLQLLVYPEDTSAYAAILRSPIARISDTAVIQLLLQKQSFIQLLHTIAKNKRLFFENTALHDEIRHDIPNIEILLTKYHEAQQLLKEKTLMDVLDHFWLECGYRYILLSRKKYHPFLRQYYVLKTMITAKRQSGAIEILTMLKQILSDDTTTGNEHEELAVLSPNNTTGIHIMTIHKAKGLEFPVVILGYMGAHFRASRTPKYKKIKGIPYIDMLSPKTFHRFFGDNKIHTSFYHMLYEQSRQDLSEELRLLYVAMTRAKKKLYLIGMQDQDKTNDAETMNTEHYLGWFNIFRDNKTNTIALPYFKEYHVKASSIVEYLRRTYYNMSRTSSSVHPRVYIEKELQHAHEITHKERIIEISPSDTAKEHANNIIKKGAERLPDPTCAPLLRKYTLYTAFGTYCHYILSRCCKGADPEQVMPHLTLEKQLLPLDDKERARFINSAVELCNGFLDSELYTSLSSSAQIFPEHAFLIWNNTHQIWMRGIIDLLIQDHNQVIIVDYKVDWHKSPEDYNLQIAAYKLAARTLLAMDSTEHIRGYLFYLRSKEAVEHTEHYDDDTLFQLLQQNR